MATDDVTSFTAPDAYERFMGRWSRALASSFAKFADVQDGEAVLDVGCGTGALSSALLAATGQSRVVGVDASAPYVTYARRSLASDRARFEVGDACQLVFADRIFDKTLSLLALNFVPDPRRALHEMTRVTRGGGVVASAVWDYGGRMEMLRVFWDEARAHNPSIASLDEAHMPLCRRGELSALWTHAGLDHVYEVSLSTTLHFADFDDYWSPFLLGQGPAGAYVVSLAADERQQLKHRLRLRLAPEGDKPITLRAQAWVVKGTVPHAL